MEFLLFVVYIIGVPLFAYNAYSEFTNKPTKLSDSKYARWLMGLFMAEFVFEGLNFFLEYFQ